MPSPVDVVLMAERNRLRLSNAGISDVGRSLNDVGQPPNAAMTKTAPKMVARDSEFVLR